MRCRRLARGYERTTTNSEAMICWATVIMTRRLARYENGQRPIKRRAANGPAPPGRLRDRTAAAADRRSVHLRLRQPGGGRLACALFLGERPTLATLLGGAVVVASVAILLINRARNPPRTHEERFTDRNAVPAGHRSFSPRRLGS